MLTINLEDGREASYKASSVKNLYWWANKINLDIFGLVGFSSLSFPLVVTKTTLKNIVGLRRAKKSGLRTKMKSFHSGYSDQEIRIKVYPF